jgi:hypothetical protein
MAYTSRAVAATSASLDPSVEIVVCIPSFRRPQHLRLTLASLAAQRTGRRFAVVMVENDALRNRMGAGGWDHVRERYHFTRLVDDTATLYRSLLERG